MSAKKNSAKETKTLESQPSIFTKENYILTLASLIVVVIGFFLMTGAEGDIYDTRRVTIAPIVVIAGFILGIYAIFFKKK